MDKNFHSELAEIIDALQKAVDGGDLGAIVNSVAALEGLAGDVHASEQHRLDPYLEENIDAAAQRLKEDGLLEIIRQEGKEAVWKLTPQGRITAQLEELIGIKRLERLHHLAGSEGEENEYEQLLEQTMSDLAPIFVWFAENGFLEVTDCQDKLLLSVCVTKKGGLE